MKRQPAWARLDDEQLLDLRLCDLRLQLRGSGLEPRIARLYRELAARGIAFRPHAWLAEEWFSPDGVPGFAVPFYLAHPRLQRLERKMTGEVEGSNHNWQMRILRHEAGHAIDSAYRLRRRARWRALFGPASQRYAPHYRARPASRRHVQHLGEWYAQAHPTEDFAETFAVWLQPHSDWRRRYAAWPARAKLEYVAEVAAEFFKHRPLVSCRDRIEALEDNTITLREHYRRKRQALRRRHRARADRALRRVFGDSKDTLFNNSKSFIGHTMGAAGALELGGNLPAFSDRVCHATINVDRLDPQCALDGLVVNEPREQRRVDVILNNSFGMLGINSVVIVKRI